MSEGSTISPFTPGDSGGTTSIAENVYEENKGLFWASIVAYLCIAVIAVLGNGLVIYAAYGNNNTGRLRYLDDVVKSLAIADMLFGLIGTPFMIVNYYLSKNEKLYF